jgi:hypothetical protein
MENKTPDKVVEKMIFKTELKEATELFNETIKKFKGEMKADGMNKIEFFPKGIDLIELTLNVEGISFKVAGPNHETQSGDIQVNVNSPEKITKHPVGKSITVGRKKSN